MVSEEGSTTGVTLLVPKHVPGADDLENEKVSNAL